MKRAMVVMGMVSSGTRLMMRILEAGGCAGDGSVDHTQRWDNEVPKGNLISFRRHIPCPPRRAKWMSDPNVFTSLKRLGYQSHAIIITRDWYCTMQSAVAAPHVETEEEGYTLAMRLWREMITGLPEDVPFTIVSYESLVQRTGPTLKWLFEHLGLEQIHDLEVITDGNEKYYQ